MKTWGVWVADEFADYLTVHVAPLLGRVHIFTQDCWCQPDTEEETDQGIVVIHHQEH